MVLVDTSVWIEAHRLDGDLYGKLALQGLLNEYEATLCGPVEMEFLGGARPNERERLQTWLNVLPYLPNDQKIWRKAAVNFSLLRNKGLTVPWNDVLVATLAVGAGCRVYAMDRHFESMAPILGFELYQPGYGGMFRPE